MFMDVMQPMTTPRKVPIRPMAKPQVKNTCMTPVRVPPIATRMPMSRVFSVTIIDSVA